MQVVTLIIKGAKLGWGKLCFSSISSSFVLVAARADVFLELNERSSRV